jgi:hypothetical protein
MATNDEILQERRQMWSNVTKLMTVITIAVAVILLLMRIFLV